MVLQRGKRDTLHFVEPRILTDKSPALFASLSHMNSAHPLIFSFFKIRLIPFPLNIVCQDLLLSHILLKTFKMFVPLARANSTEDCSFYLSDSPNFLSVTIIIHIGLMTCRVPAYTQHPIWALKFILRFFDPGFGNTCSRHKGML
jgi:hypothetical protein